MSAIGDVVFASPLIGAIKSTHPEAEIYWLAEPTVKELLMCNPDIQGVIEFPKSRFKKLLKERRFLTLAKEFAAFVKALRAYHFDTAIDAQGLLKSASMAWLSGAKKRFGFRSREYGHLLLTDTTDKGGDSREISSEYYHLIRFTGLDEKAPLQLALCPKDEEKAEALIEERGLQRGFIALAPFTTRPQKHWFESSWERLIPMLRKRFGLPVVILGSPADRESAESIAKKCGAIDLAGETGIGEAAALVGKSSLLIGVDTGLTHMAVAQMRPTIALFGATVPYQNTPNPKAVVLYHRLECSPCRRRPTCGGTFDCMRAITPEEVLNTAETLLESGS